uniref:G-protein coupled receptors family 1 profile domain-containing protein n=1 Tax=Anser cygnoides TaxID=8845 RepID=A0A8B9DT66_ANSCY
GPSAPQPWLPGQAGMEVLQPKLWCQFCHDHLLLSPATLLDAWTNVQPLTGRQGIPCCTWEGQLTSPCFAGHVPEIVIGSIMLLIGLCGLVGNGAILWLLGFHIRRNLFTSYALNLAVADACFLLCTSVSLVMYHVPMLSCFHPQLLHVLLPFHSRFSCSGLSPVCCQGSCTLCMIWVTLNAAGWFLQPYAFSVSAFSPPFMVISNVILFIKLRCRSWQYHPGRLYIIFLNFYVYTNFIFDICLLLAAINSSSNPIIYVLVGNYKKQNFRESVKMALQRVFEDRADPRMVGEGPVSRITYILNKGTEIEYVKALAGDSSKGVSSAYWTVS